MHYRPARVICTFKESKELKDFDLRCIPVCLPRKHNVFVTRLAREHIGSEVTLDTASRAISHARALADDRSEKVSLLGTRLNART